MTKMNPKNGNEAKPNIFPRDIFKSDMIFDWSQILKHFDDIYNWYLSTSLQK